MSVRRIIDAFEEWRPSGEPMVLCTVYETMGSTYSKAGHRILIAANGDYQGLVSGGCLEGDLAERAQHVLSSGACKAITYDLRDEADELWGLGVGCNGLLRVFLQQLSAEQQYEPFASIAAHQLSNAPAAVATIIESTRADLPAGATVLHDARTTRAWGVGSDARELLAEGCERAMVSGAASLAAHEGAYTVLYAPLVPVPRLLVLGAGLDAIPVVNLAAELGWLVTVADHRPAYLERGGFARAERRMAIDPARLGEFLRPEAFDAILVMSHHLVSDRSLLSQLADVEVGYLGVLGPAARRERLLQDLGAAGNALHEKLKGPVGLDIGADSPETIALAVLAEIQATLSGRDAAPLSEKITATPRPP